VRNWEFVTRREEFLIFSVLIGLSILASLVAFVLRRRAGGDPNPVLELDNLVARIQAWWVTIPLPGGAFIAGSHAVMIMFAPVSFAALRDDATLADLDRLVWLLYDPDSGLCVSGSADRGGDLRRSQEFIGQDGGDAVGIDDRRLFPGYQGSSASLPAFLPMVVQASDVTAVCLGKAVRAS
jgi:hypothetical protein